MLSQVKKFLQARNAATVTEIMVETRLSRETVLQALDYFVRTGCVRQEIWESGQKCTTKCKGCSLEDLCIEGPHGVKAFVWNSTEKLISK